MKKIALVALPLTLVLCACGSTDDASTAAEADTVEMPADEAMAGVTEEPVADPNANAAADTAAEATDAAQATAEEAGANAAEVAARAQAAAAAAETATDAQ